MARIDRRSAANAPGDVFVDDSCIACDTCRRLAPATFGGGEDDVAFVSRQPAPGEERRRAMMALVACPVAAIGSSSKEGAAEAARAFPVEAAPGVLDCGYAAESSFGAASWLVLRPGGNVLVDSPRFAAPLAARIRALGGARLMFLTHRDDVADHARWAEALGCARVLHARDVSGRTRGVERIVEGDAPVPLADGVAALPVPGHTAGSMALHVGDEYLFTGDHLWGDAEGRLGASRAVCWWDWDAQTASMEKLGALRFRWVFPGHGRPWRAATHDEARREVLALARAMRGRA
ncbi:MAG TPA: MBL fold metallo-hydrolase [Anaeromyxobacter sp.]|nr:MBL fold metallo-hydrolase [Anaeromyxobacter sp.]